MNSLILSVFFAVVAQGAGAETPPEQIVEVVPAPALVTVEVPAKIAKAYAYVDRVTVVKVNEEFELPAGKHEIIVLAPGYYDFGFDVELKAGEKKKLAVRTLVPGYSTLEGMAENAGSMIYYAWDGNWPQTAVHPWQIDGNAAIIDGNPLPGSSNSFMVLSTYMRFRSTEFVFRFDYVVERGSVDIYCCGRKLPTTGGRHSVILYAAENGSYLIVDWMKYPASNPSTSINVKWKAKTSARIVFRNFSFVDVAAQKAAAAGN